MISSISKEIAPSGLLGFSALSSDANPYEAEDVEVTIGGGFELGGGHDFFLSRFARALAQGHEFDALLPD